MNVFGNPGLPSSSHSNTRSIILDPDYYNWNSKAFCTLTSLCMREKQTIGPWVGKDDRMYKKKDVSVDVWHSMNRRRAECHAEPGRGRHGRHKNLAFHKQCIVRVLLVCFSAKWVWYSLRFLLNAGEETEEGGGGKRIKRRRKLPKV